MLSKCRGCLDIQMDVLSVFVHTMLIFLAPALENLHIFANVYLYILKVTFNLGFNSKKCCIDSRKYLSYTNSVK